VWTVITEDPDLLAEVSAAIDVIEKRGQLARIRRRLLDVHPRRGAHKCSYDGAIVDCLTEACAFAWADLRGPHPQFDFGKGKPDICAPPDVWIEAKQSDAHLRMAQPLADDLGVLAVVEYERGVAVS
jgi:hypothetical protein